MKLKLANPFKYTTFLQALLYCFAVAVILSSIPLFIIKSDLDILFKIFTGMTLLSAIFTVLTISLKIQYNICTGNYIQKHVYSQNDIADETEGDDECCSDFGDEEYDDEEEFEDDPEELGDCSECEDLDCPDRK